LPLPLWPPRKKFQVGVWDEVGQTNPRDPISKYDHAETILTNVHVDLGADPHKELIATLLF
jgi:hypothetical protein